MNVVLGNVWVLLFSGNCSTFSTLVKGRWAGNRFFMVLVSCDPPCTLVPGSFQRVVYVDKLHICFGGGGSPFFRPPGIPHLSFANVFMGLFVVRARYSRLGPLWSRKASASANSTEAPGTGYRLSMRYAKMKIAFVPSLFFVVHMQTMKNVIYKPTLLFCSFGGSEFFVFISEHT